MAAMATSHPRHTPFDRSKYCPQLQSPLFSIISAEIRDRIFDFALAAYEDTSRQYANDTCYRRPEQLAPRRSDTALLRTCQRIYDEAWFRPWTTSEHHFWLSVDERRPPNVATVKRMARSFYLIHTAYGDIELARVRVCAQLFLLENGRELDRILRLRHFFPRMITITVRHTDFWWWESDQPLRIGGNWVGVCLFPNSVRRLCVEIESLERKKNQIDHLANEMVHKWTFTRRDGVKLQSAGQGDIEITRWSGTSTWQDRRWVRDETSPGTLQYYVATVSFRPAPLIPPAASSETNNTPLFNPGSLDISFPPERHTPVQSTSGWDFVWTTELAAATSTITSVADSTSVLPAEEAVARVRRWREENPELAARLARSHPQE